MSQSLVNVGTVANDGTGDPLRNAYIKLNANDFELYSLLDREIKTIVKNAHGFVSGNVLYLDNSGIFQKITTPSTQIPIGIVQTVIDANTFQLVEGGYVTSLSGLTAGTVYYVQTTGLLGTTVTSLKYLVADSATSGYILSGAGSSMAIGNAVISGTPGSVLFIDSSGFLAQDNGNFYFNNSTHQLSVFTNGDFTGVDAINVYNEVDAFNPNSTQGAIGSGLESGFTFSTARGTGASPTVISSGDLLGGVSGWGYTGSSPAYISLAGMWSTAQGSASTLGGKLDFRTRADGGALTSRMTIDNTGIMSVISLNAGGMVKSTITTGALSVAAPGTDYLAPNGSGAALTDVWLLASGGTLSGPNVVTGTTTNTFKMVFNNLGVTQTDGAGIYLQNQQAATLGAQQISPSITWEGNAFATTPGSTMVVKYIADVLPVQGLSTVSALWRLRSSLNGSAYADALTINPSGVLTLVTTGFGSLILSSNLVSTNQTTLTFQTQSTNRLVINNGGGITHTQAPISGGGVTFVSTPGAHTGIASNTEAVSRDFQGATQTWFDGTVATQRFNYFRGYTLNKTTTSATFTKAYNVYIDPLTLGTGVTGTSYALGINGNIELIANNSDLRFSGSGVSLTFSQGGTIQTSGGSSLNINAGSAAITSTSNGWTITQTISAATPVLKIVPFAATSLTASTEFVAVDFQNATQTWATGSLATQRWNYFRGYTAAFVGVSTLTNAYTVYIDPPVQGTNATLTNRWSLGLNGALQLYAGTTTMPPLVFQSGTNSSTIINGAVEFDGTHFYGAISGSRVQLDNQVAANGWLANGATTITGNTSQSGAFTETMSFNKVSVTQNVLSGVNNLVALTVETNAHTTQTFSSNATTLGVNQSTFTIQFNTGAISTIATSVLASGNTYSFVGSSTITDAPNVWINGIPKSGTNATITNAHGILISSTATTGTVTNSYGLTVNAQTGATNNFSAQFAGGIGLKFTQASQSGTHNFLDITQSAHTGGSPTGIKFNAGAHTALAASTEAIDVNFNFNRIVQFSTGALSRQVALSVFKPIYSFVASSTITDAASLYVDGAPVAGSNATINRSHAIWSGGSVRIDGNLNFRAGATVDIGTDDNNSLRFKTSTTVHQTIDNLGNFTFNSGSAGGDAYTFSQGNQTTSVSTFTINQGLYTSGTPTGVKYIGNSHTGLTASETIDANWNLSRTVQFTGSTGFALQRAFVIQNPTYSFVSATGTIITAATLAIVGAPLTGTNAAFTDSHGLLIQAAILNTNVTSSYGITVNSQSGATNNYAAQFLGGNVGFRTSAPVSYLEIAGSYGDAITTLSANTTLDATHATILGDATSASITITLPSASGATRRIYRINKKDSSANTVTISTTAGGNKVISTQYAGFVVQSNGTSWYVIGSF